MGHEELARYLIRGAELRREEILSRAREEAEALLAEAREEAERMEREFREEATREAAAERRVRMDRARHEAGEWILRARASLAEEVLARLSARLGRLPGESRYPSVAEKLFRELLPELPGGTIIVRADAAARAALEPLVSGRDVKLVPLPDGEQGGVEALDEAETVLLRNTLGARLMKARPDLLVAIGRELADPHE